MRVYASSLTVEEVEELTPQDILDAVETLDLPEVLSTTLPAPGKGPDFFLDWAGQELSEAETAADGDVALRKYYNAAVYSKGAIECLVDWYLQKLMLDFTIPQFASTAQKLEVLNSEQFLGITFSLFNDIVFEPRNRGVHQFELVTEREAKHGYELARLTLKNCVHHVSPSEAPVFYGKVVAYTGDAALEKMSFKGKGEYEEAFYFEGIGVPGDHAVLLNREAKGGVISVLEVRHDGKVSVRSSRIRGRFSSEQMRKLFDILGRAEAQPIERFNRSERQQLVEMLIPKTTSGRAP